MAHPNMPLKMDSNFNHFIQRHQQLKRDSENTNKLIEDLLLHIQGVESTLFQENQRLSSSLEKYEQDNQRLTSSLQDIEQDNQRLSTSLSNAELDLKHEATSRRDLQTRLQQAQQNINLVYQENDRLKNRNPYVLILIDGDGLIFQEHWLKQGLEGGKRAAYALRAAVSEFCREQVTDIEIIAKVFANVTGLGRAMLRDGSIADMSDLKEFALGFTQAKASFDFIDVGYGKERADSKIKEITRWNLRNHNCKQILLGISHDSGYAPFLDEILEDNKTRNQVSILEGFPTVRELVSTDVNVINLNNDLFRSSKLTAPAPAPLVSVPPVQSTVVSTPATSNASASPAQRLATTASYANVIGKSSPPPQLTMPLAPRTAPPPRGRSAQAALSWKPGRRGLDDPISVNQQAMDSIKKRKDNNKLCNNYYLRGPCSKGEGCSFVHNYNPSKDEIKAIALLSRLNPCVNGQDCEVEDCIYGHHCPSIKDGTCMHPYCKFKVDAHPPGTKFKNSNIRDN